MRNEVSPDRIKLDMKSNKQFKQSHAIRSKMLKLLKKCLYTSKPKIHLTIDILRIGHKFKYCCRSTPAKPADRLSLQERKFPDPLQTKKNFTSTKLYVSFIN